MNGGLGLGLKLGFGGAGSVGPVGPVTPADLANLVRWHKADGLLYKDAAGTDPADTQLDPIGNWNNADGGNALIMSTTAKKPLLLVGEAPPQPTPSVYSGNGTAMMYSAESAFASDYTICAAFQWDTGTQTTFISGSIDGINTYWNLVAANGFLYIGHTDSSVFKGVNVFANTFVDDSHLILFLRVKANAGANTYSLFQYTGGALTQIGSDQTAVYDMPVVDTFSIFGIKITSEVVSYKRRMYENFMTSDLMTIGDMEDQGATLSEKWGIL